MYCIVAREYNESHFNHHLFQVYCRRTDKWTRLADLPDYRSGFCSGSFMGKIYVFGGNRFTGDNSLEYDIDKNSWNQIANMISPNRTDASCVVFNGQCVVAGGFLELTCGNYTNSVDSYDHYLNKWSRLPNMGAKKRLPGLLSKGNKLYVIGGSGGFYDQPDEVYDCLTNQFSFIAPHSDLIEYFNKVSLFSDGKNIIVIDNFTDFSQDRSFELDIPTYNIVENKWYMTVMNFPYSLNDFRYTIVSFQKYLK